MLSALLCVGSYLAVFVRTQCTIAELPQAGCLTVHSFSSKNIKYITESCSSVINGRLGSAKLDYLEDGV